MTGAIGATIEGLCLDGDHLGEGIDGVLVDKPDYGKEEDAWRIERCRIARFSGDGVHLGRIWCFSIRHCMICFNKGNGLRVRGWDGFVLDNWLCGNRSAGYGAYDENASITMTGNRIEWNATAGIEIRRRQPLQHHRQLHRPLRRARHQARCPAARRRARSSASPAT